MEDLITAFVDQVPNLAALILIVVVFIKYLEKRDRILEQITRELKALSVAQATHARETTDAIADMHRTVHRVFEDRTT